MKSGSCAASAARGAGKGLIAMNVWREMNAARLI